MSRNTNKLILNSLTLAFALLLLLPHKSLAFFTKETTLNSNSISAGYWEKYDFSNPKTAANSIGKILLAKNFGLLYTNLAKDLAGIYTKEEFIKALGNAKITSFKIIGDTVYTNSKQAYIVMEITYPEGSLEKYKTVLNYEEGQWKLLGTKAVN